MKQPINEKREPLERMTSKLEVLNPHQAFVLLKNTFGDQAELTDIKVYIYFHLQLTSTEYNISFKLVLIVDVWRG